MSKSSSAVPAGLSTASVLDRMIRLMGKDERMVLLEAGHASGSLAGFAKSYPRRFFNMDLSELEMVSVASGLAVSGMEAWVCAPCWRLVPRAWDAIRGLVAIPQLPVKFIGTGAGFALGAEGASLQMLEDVALMKSLPGMTILVPSDEVSLGRALRFAKESLSPVYVRLGERLASPVVRSSSGELPLSLGNLGELLRDGDGVTICACGIMVQEALKASDILSGQGINAAVVDCVSVKPLPESMILDSVRKTGCCVTAEEHSINGGFGESVAAAIGRNFPVPVEQVGVLDKAGQSGSPSELRDYYGLSYRQIVSAAMQAWTMRRR